MFVPAQFAPALTVAMAVGPLLALVVIGLCLTAIREAE